MNANELANFIRDISEYTEFNGRHYCQQCFKEAQDMLLQQQAEIEALKFQLNTTITSKNLEKPAKYSDAWWKEVAEFNKARKAQK